MFYFITNPTDLKFVDIFPPSQAMAGSLVFLKSLLTLELGG